MLFLIVGLYEIKSEHKTNDFVHHVLAELNGVPLTASTML